MREARVTQLERSHQPNQQFDANMPSGKYISDKRDVLHECDRHRNPQRQDHSLLAERLENCGRESVKGPSMKYLFSFLLTLLVGTLGMWGQTQGPSTLEYNGIMPRANMLLRMNAGGIVEEPMCDDLVEFHGHKKAIKDIFPEECLSGDAVKSGDCRIGGDVCTTTIPLESPDVPAIEGETDYCFGYYWGCWVKDDKGNPVPYFDWHPGSAAQHLFTWTCKDKNRILQHDENKPANFWCHKPESSPKS
jgi:hypothetical protein